MRDPQTTPKFPNHPEQKSFDTDQPPLYTGGKEVNFAPDLQAQLDQLAATTGRPAHELIQDTLIGYIGELRELRGMLDSRYDDIENGRVQLIGGDEARARLKANTEIQRNRRG